MPVTHKFYTNTHTRTYTYINIFSKQTRTQTHTPIHINISIYNVATHCTTLQDRCRTSRLAGLTPSSPPAQSFTFHRSVSVLKLVYSCVGGLRVYTYTREHEYTIVFACIFSPCAFCFRLWSVFNDVCIWQCTGEHGNVHQTGKHSVLSM